MTETIVFATVAYLFVGGWVLGRLVETLGPCPAFLAWLAYPVMMIGWPVTCLACASEVFRRKAAITALLALAAVLIAGPTAPAQPCQSGHCAAPVVQTPVVVAPAVATILPLYGAGYTGGSGSEQTDLLRQLLDEIKALRADVADLKAGGGVPPLKARATEDPTAILKANCASCHTGQKSRAEFQLFTDKGEPVFLNGPTRKEILARVKAQPGHPVMPPPGHDRLTPAQIGALEAAFSTAKAPDPAPPKN